MARKEAHFLSPIKKIGAHPFVNLLAMIFAGGAVVIAALSYWWPAEPNLQIDFNQITAKPYTAHNPPNSQTIYPVSQVPGYKMPPPTLLNVVSISNQSRVAAPGVRVTLVLKDPFRFVNIAFDGKNWPEGTWTVIPNYDTYQLATVELKKPIPPRESMRFFFTYTYSKALQDLERKAEEPNALHISVSSALTKRLAEEESYLLKYYGEEESDKPQEK